VRNEQNSQKLNTKLGDFSGLSLKYISLSIVHHKF